MCVVHYIFRCLYILYIHIFYFTAVFKIIMNFYDSKALGCIFHKDSLEFDEKLVYIYK